MYNNSFINTDESFNLWRPFFVDCRLSSSFRGNVVSCMYRFSVSVVKITLPKCVFVEELNLWWRGTHEYYKNTTKIEPQEILMIPKFSLQSNFHSVCCLVAPRKLMFIELQYLITYCIYKIIGHQFNPS